MDRYATLAILTTQQQHPQRHSTLSPQNIPYSPIWRTKQGKTSSEQSNQLFKLLLCYSDVFADDADDMGHTTAAKHTIEKAGSAPIQQRPR